MTRFSPAPSVGCSTISPQNPSDPQWILDHQVRPPKVQASREAWKKRFGQVLLEAVMRAPTAGSAAGSLRLPGELDAQQACERFKVTEEQLNGLHARRLSWNESWDYATGYIRERVKFYKVCAAARRQQQDGRTACHCASLEGTSCSRCAGHRSRGVVTAAQPTATTGRQEEEGCCF